MATLYHQLMINAPAAKVFQALSTIEGIGSWWDTPKAGEHEQLAAWLFEPGAGHDVLIMAVDESVPNSRILWRCVSEHEESSPASAWFGTGIVFELAANADKTMLEFRHAGWDESNRYLGFCNFQWAMSLKALKDYCERR
ncbi:MULTISPECIES: SRPBCC domain-containing protein [Pseudomonas]|jgi:uncharacterized protein YndB with AHSA1/START domain|uniref:SRPBCC family protein n=1 Tax=Pseudomonas TaxID=286 RepID=UPI000C11B4AC|nr:hypothetical protein [Pseudomonadaceae bacterium]MBQ55250.1 hypothetical protein [Pseudomonadaceae bacterium]|tara:strand:+ start:104 stop:523 length:420 start_codon:yes stop_codon:yes gene_type:complete